MHNGLSTKAEGLLTKVRAMTPTTMFWDQREEETRAGTCDADALRVAGMFLLLYLLITGGNRFTGPGRSLLQSIFII